MMKKYMYDQNTTPGTENCIYSWTYTLFL